jgi:hypothetical protein
MSSEEIGNTIQNILYLITLITIITSFFGFTFVNINWNNSSYCKARSRLLYIILYIGINRTATLCLTNFLDIPESHCIILVIFYKILIPRAIETVAFIAVRSFLLYKLTLKNLKKQFKYLVIDENQNLNPYIRDVYGKSIKIINRQEEDGLEHTEESIKKIIGVEEKITFKRIKKYISNFIFPNPEKQVTDKSLFFSYLIVYIITGIIPLITIISLSISNTEITDICNAPSIDTWSKISGAFGIISCIVIFILLKPVRDGYFLKKEIIIHASLGIAGLFIYPFLFTIDNIDWIELSYIMIITDLMLITSFIYIPYLVYQEVILKNTQIPNSNLNLHSQRESTNEDIYSDNNNNNNLVVMPFQNHPQFLETMKSQNAIDFINEFLREYGPKYNYIYAIYEFIKFESVKADIRTAAAFLLYSKYIKYDGVDCLGFPDRIVEYYSKIDPSNTANVEKVDTDYFYKALLCIENSMTDQDIKILINCDIHKKYYKQINLQNHGFHIV